jgi:hypothetical protein
MKVSLNLLGPPEIFGPYLFEVAVADEFIFEGIRELVIPPMAGYFGPYPLLLVVPCGGILDGVARRCICFVYEG